MHQRILGGILGLLFSVLIPLNARAVGPIVSISISPATAELGAGSKQDFTVQGKDANGVSADLTANSTFRTTDPNGSVSANSYTAGTTGSWVVTAHYGTLSADTAVTVTPGPIAELTINPNSSPEYVTNGQSRSFTAEAFDAFDNKISNFTVQWSVEGKIGTVKSLSAASGKFSAADVGSGRIVARSGNETAAVPVTVTKSTVVETTNANTNASNVSAVNTNTNAPNAGNGNTNESITASTNTNSASAASTTESCTPWARTTWVWIFIAYAVLLGLSLVTARVSRPSWWWVAPLVLTVVALWLYFQYRCYPVYPAWPYLVLLLGIIGASWYNWQRSAPPKL